MTARPSLSGCVTLADTYGVDYTTVKQMALALGPSELFDGLVLSIQDLG